MLRRVAGNIPRVSGVVVKCPEKEGRTQQHFAKECDINHVMKRYAKTGVLVDPSIVRRRSPMFGDYAKMGDYHQICIQILGIQKEFQKLPAAVREKFKNDPGELIPWLANPQNREEAIKLGLRKAPPAKPEEKKEEKKPA